MPKLIAVSSGIVVRVAANAEAIPTALQQQWATEFGLAVVLPDSAWAAEGDAWNGTQCVEPPGNALARVALRRSVEAAESKTDTAGAAPWQRGFFRVLDKDLTAPPGVAPNEGDRFIVASPATGAWATHENHVAEYTLGAYVFSSIPIGCFAFVEDEAELYRRVGGVWTLAAMVGEPGAQGPQGPTGADGPQGPQGAQGSTGAQGTTGAAGADGAAGATGSQGPAGADGADGEIGATGAQGPQGAAGPQGTQGAAGSQGPPGADGITRAAAATVAAGPLTTWLVLADNSSDITGTALTTVMSITGVDAGRYWFSCSLVYQTTALTTGIDVAVNHTGTTTQFGADHRFTSTGTTASTGAATQIAAGATGAIREAQGTRTKNAIIGAGTVSVDTINADMRSTIEGFFVVSVTGTLEIKLAAEAAGLVARAMQGSFLELKKLS
jgi:hypothetical protein